MVFKIGWAAWPLTGEGAVIVLAISIGNNFVLILVTTLGAPRGDLGLNVMHYQLQFSTRRALRVNSYYDIGALIVDLITLKRKTYTDLRCMFASMG